MLSFRAEIEARSNDNDGPMLLTAVWIGDASIVQLLLIKKPRPMTETQTLQVAIRNGYETVVHALLNTEQTLRPLIVQWTRVC